MGFSAFFIGSTAAFALEEDSRAQTIIFTDGADVYRFTLAELGLARIGEQDGRSLTEDIVVCRDHAALSYRLFRLSQQINKPAVDAGFYLVDPKKLEIYPEQSGRELDLGLLIARLGNPGLYRKTYPLPIKTVLPRVTAEQLRNKYPDTLWAEYTTVLANIPDRTENVRIASGFLDGLYFSPGEEVSFNSTVGPRVSERGYKAAKVIVAGGFEPGLGGGVCQVSSTLYNTLLLAGLEIKERHNHSVRIAYVPLGRDATVVYGSKDLIFVNNTDSYLLLKAGVRGLELTMQLYGNGPPRYENITLQTKTIQRIPFSQVEIIDKTLPPGEKKVLERGQDGYRTETYRLLESGGTIKEELLSQDYYQPIDAKVLTNPLHE